MGIFLSLITYSAPAHKNSVWSKIAAATLHQWIDSDTTKASVLWILEVRTMCIVNKCLDTIKELLPCVVGTLVNALYQAIKYDYAEAGLLYLVLQNIIMCTAPELMVFYQPFFCNICSSLPVPLAKYCAQRASLPLK